MGVHVHELQHDRHAPSACRLLHRVSPMSSLTAFATLYAQAHDCFDLLELTGATPALGPIWPAKERGRARSCDAIAAAAVRAHRTVFRASRPVQSEGQAGE